MRALAVVLVLVAGSAGCGTKESRPEGAPLPAPPAVVEVVMRDFSFHPPRQIPPGRVVFKVRNTGTRTHRMDLVPLPDEMPPIDVQLRGNQRRPVSTVASVSSRRPGQAGTFAVDLAPGKRYALLCLLTDEAGNHALKGMSAEFRPAAPEASR